MSATLGRVVAVDLHEQRTAEPALDDPHAWRALAAAATRTVGHDPARWWRRERTLAEDPKAELSR